MKKKPLNLSISEDLIRKAREYNINFSSFLEDRLREHLSLIEHDESYISSYYDRKKKRVIDSQK